jgi:peptide/nickel transport system permease protein
LTRFVTRRLLHTLSVLLLVSFGVTFLINLAPGNPADTILGVGATQQQVAELDKALHLNNPFYLRYWDWLRDLLQGNFGTSYYTHLPVLGSITQAVPVTGELIVVAFLMALVVSIPIGIYAAYRADGRFDRMWSVASSALISSPPFISAILLVYVFALLMRNFPIRFPATGWTDLTAGLGSNLWHVFLPALTLALLLIPAYSRLLRADMVATLQEDYILSARAKGLSNRRILLVHALRQSSFSLVTLAGLSLGQLISGAAIIEVIFALPGLGQLIVNAVLAKDVPLVQGSVMFVAIVYVFLNMAVDLAYGYLDPRVRRRRVVL